MGKQQEMVVVMPIDILKHIVEIYEPTAVVQAHDGDSVLCIDARKSLFRLGTVLEGAIEMYNAVYTSFRIIWVAKSKYHIRLEHIVL